MGTPPPADYVQGGTIISSEMCDEVVQALKSNTTKTILMDQVEIPEEIAIAIAVALEKNTSLEKLKFMIQMSGARTYELGDKFGPALASMIEKNGSLLELSLGNCNFSDEAGVAIAAALEKNKALKKVELYNCGGSTGWGADEQHWITDKTGVALAAALEKNNTLETVSIQEMKGFGDRTGLGFAQVLEKNSALRELWCSSVKFPDETGLRMAAALEKNASLENLLFICCEGLSDKTGEALLTALENNKTLKTLNVNGTRINQDIKDKLEKKMAR
jgi:hypothetical protein